ncbi:MAG: hydantoinase B/oxoprolinase family protein [Alphaproteobacteria bacterium]|jgi:N-methylhydantoinase B|nr:hydantoinase B/oxoprolinase family protein [Alphaproteobacteria bacterium]
MAKSETKKAGGSNATSSGVSPVVLAVLRGRLEQIADEMDATLFRSAFNPIIAEAHDASHGLYDAKTGDTLVQGKEGLPVFVGVMAFAVKFVIDKTVDNPPEEGDVYIFNDPYEGGTHLSDFKLVRPVFRNGQIFCWLASVGHWHDVGGNVPGNYNPVATESFAEGVHIPPVKLFRKGQLQTDILDILQTNSRLPLSVYGDLNAQISALELGEARLFALLDEYGDDTVAAVFAELRARAHLQMENHIEAIEDGTVSATDWLDNDGISDEALPVAVDVSIKGRKMILDFSRSAGSVAGPVNISRSTAIAACYVALKHLFPDVPANAGVLDPVEIVIPEESLLSARPPRPVGGYTETILRIIDVIFTAIGQIDPARALANAYGTINALSLAGHRQDGSRWVMFSFFGGGHGGHSEGDGLSHGNAPISMATIPPLEILESAYPVAFRKWALRADSGGAGAQRGGLGAIYQIEILSDGADGFFFGERGRHAPNGVGAGQKAAFSRFSWQAEKGAQAALPEMTSKKVGIKLAKGGSVLLETPGGGGYGDPLDRSADQVMDDLRLGYISAEKAASDYGLVLDAGGGLDAPATEKQRTKIRQSR